MLKWSLVFLIVAAIAGLLGYKNVETAFATAAKYLIFLVLVLILTLLLFNVLVANA